MLKPKPTGALLAPTPANIALLQQQLAERTGEVKEAKKLEKGARVALEFKARENFAVLMKSKLPSDVHKQFAVLFFGLQLKTATPEMLEAAISAMPVHPLFAPIEADLSVGKRPRPQTSTEEEEAKTYARRRNKQAKEVE